LLWLYKVGYIYVRDYVAERECYWQDTNEVLGESPVLGSLYQPQIPHLLDWDRTRPSTLRSQRRNAWTMARLAKACREFCIIYTTILCVLHNTWKCKYNLQSLIHQWYLYQLFWSNMHNKAKTFRITNNVVKPAVIFVNTQIITGNKYKLDQVF
jgi:hypothetical protein